MSSPPNGFAETTRLRRMYALGVMTFILFLSTLVGVPVLPRLCVELGAGSAVIPIVVSASLVTAVVAQFFAGSLADRYSERSLIVVGAFLGSISSLLCVIATTWPQLFFLRVAGGLADALAMPALLVITASLGEGQPGRFFGILRGSQGLSFVIGPVVGSVFSLVSLRAPFVVDGLLSLAAMVAAIFLVPGAQKAASEHSLSILAGLRRTFSDKRIYLYLLIGMSGIFGFGILYTFVATKAQLMRLEPWQVGVILGAGALVFSIVSFLAGKMSDKCDRRTMVIASEVIMIVGAIGLLLSGRFASLVTFYAVFCIGEATVFLLAFVYAAGAFDKKHMGASMGAFDAVLDLSLFVGPLLGAALYATTGRVALPFLLACAPAMLALIGVIGWLPGDDPPRPPAAS